MYSSRIRLMMLLLTFSATSAAAISGKDSPAATKLSKQEVEDHSAFNDNRIVEQCDVFVSAVESGSNTKLVAEFAAKLAGYITERLRHKGNLTDASESGLTLKGYMQQCGDKVTSITKVEVIAGKGDVSSLHANALLDYALAIHRPEQEDDIIMEVRKSRWLYHNNLDYIANQNNQHHHLILLL